MQHTTASVPVQPLAEREASFSAAAALVLVSITGCVPSTRSSSRAVISGRVQLAAVEGAADMSRVRVDPCAMLVTYLAFRFDVVGGAFSALLLGLLLDVMSGAPMGLHMLSLMALFVTLRLAANAVQLEPGVRLFPVALVATLADPAVADRFRTMREDLEADPSRIARVRAVLGPIEAELLAAAHGTR